MFLGALIGFGLFLQDPAWFHVFVPGQLAGGRGPGASTEALRDVLFEVAVAGAGSAWRIVADSAWPSGVGHGWQESPARPYWADMIRANTAAD